MKAITQEWIDKAEEDWNSLDVLFRSRKHCETVRAAVRMGLGMT